MDNVHVCAYTYIHTYSDEKIREKKTELKRVSVEGTAVTAIGNGKWKMKTNHSIQRGQPGTKREDQSALCIWK